MATRTVTISVGKSGLEVDDPAVGANKTDRVEWKAATEDLEWMVVVQGKKPLSNQSHRGQSPFTGNQRIFEGKGTAPVGEKLKGGGLNYGEAFKYVVVRLAGGQSEALDPDIVIEDIRVGGRGNR